MIEDHNPFKLTPEENNAYFERELRPELAAGSKAVEQPIFILVGGQPGAGKSRVTAGAKNSLENNTIVLDADLFRPEHPRYDQIVESAPLKVFELARDDVNEWLRLAGDFAIANKRNVIMDGTLRDKNNTAKLAETYRQAGYKIELIVVATNERNSHTSTFERYEEGIELTGTGRYVEPDFHKAAYKAIPKTVQHLEENKLIDRVKIYSRNGEVLYENKLVNGEWEKAPEAVKALNKERDKEPTLEEIQWLEKQRANTLALMEKRKAPESEKEYVKLQFQAYPIPSQEKKRGDIEILRKEEDARSSELYIAQPDRVYPGVITHIKGDSVIQELSPGVAVEHRGLAGALRQDDIGTRFSIAYDSKGGVTITQEHHRDTGHEIDR